MDFDKMGLTELEALHFEIEQRMNTMRHNQKVQKWSAVTTAIKDWINHYGTITVNCPELWECEEYITAETEFETMGTFILPVPDEEEEE